MGTAGSAYQHVWSALKILLLVCVLVAAGYLLYPVWQAAHPTPRTSPSGTGPTPRPWSRWPSRSWRSSTPTKKTVSLSDVTVRYYFTADGGAAYGFDCVDAAMGCSNLSGTIVPLANPTADATHYLELTFRPAPGALAPGANSKGINLQLFRLDHQNLNQASDHFVQRGRHHLQAVQAGDRLPARHARLGNRAARCGGRRRRPGAALGGAYPEAVRPGRCGVRQLPLQRPHRPRADQARVADRTR